MDKKDSSIILAFGLVVAGWIGWVVMHYDQLQLDAPQAQTEGISLEEDSHHKTSAPVSSASVDVSQSATHSPLGPVPDGGFPLPTVEIVNGRPERTIHMGVRQYAWDPPVIEAKYGELIRLIVHNADVQHGLVIPDLNVLNIDIPPDGAVIEFEASKVGTFPFFCSYYCGEDHSIMRGKIVIE